MSRASIACSSSALRGLEDAESDGRQLHAVVQGDRVRGHASTVGTARPGERVTGVIPPAQHKPRVSSPTRGWLIRFVPLVWVTRPEARISPRVAQLLNTMRDVYETLALPSTPGLSFGTYLPEPGSSSADALDMLRGWIATPSAAPSISEV